MLDSVRLGVVLLDSRFVVDEIDDVLIARQDFGRHEAVVEIGDVVGFALAGLLVDRSGGAGEDPIALDQILALDQRQVLLPPTAQFRRRFVRQ